MYMVVAFGISCGEPFCNVLSVHDTADQARAAVAEWVDFDGGYTAADNGDYIKKTRIGNYAVDSFIGVRKPAYKN